MLKKKTRKYFRTSIKPERSTCQNRFSITLITASLTRCYQNCFVKSRRAKSFARFTISLFQWSAFTIILISIFWCHSFYLKFFRRLMKDLKSKCFVDFFIDIEMFIFNVFRRVFSTNEKEQNERLWRWKKIVSLIVFNSLTFYCNFSLICRIFSSLFFKLINFFLIIIN